MGHSVNYPPQTYLPEGMKEMEYLSTKFSSDIGWGLLWGTLIPWHLWFVAWVTNRVLNARENLQARKYSFWHFEVRLVWDTEIGYIDGSGLLSHIYVGHTSDSVTWPTGTWLSFWSWFCGLCSWASQSMLFHINCLKQR